MLVLSRKLTESIQLGDNIVVTVLELLSNKVRIGIQAPKGISILRSELQRHDSNSTESLRSPLSIAAIYSK